MSTLTEAYLAVVKAQKKLEFLTQHSTCSAKCKRLLHEA
jgi:hypothetical protein